MRLLLVEDDAMLGSGMERALRLAGFTVDRVADGGHALQAVQAQGYDAILLDIGLPKVDGLQVLRTMRGQGIETPVLLITARNAIQDRVAGLNAGADDYLCKPFDLDELTARIHAVTRRRAGRASPVLQLGRLRLDPIARQACLGERVLPLSPREFDLLELLLRQPGAVMSIEALETHLYAWDKDVNSNAVAVHLHHLRRKLGEPWIVNVRGVGYKLIDPS